MFLKEYFNGDEGEFKQFINTLKEKLPIVFRFNCNLPGYENII